MPTHHFRTLDVFTDQRFGGNPLAVFPDATGIPEDLLQRIANELNLSETTFVLPPADPRHTARVRIFNPAAEMPFAGHPMVGTAWVLAGQLADPVCSLTFEVPAGLVNIDLHREAGELRQVTIHAPLPLSIGPQIPVEEIAACAGLPSSDFVTSAHQPMEISMGNPLVVARVRPEALDTAVPNGSQFKVLLQRHAYLNGQFLLYLYSRDGGAVRSRMFAPEVGIQEDPATGSAAAPLAAFLLSLDGGDQADFTIRQGEAMGRPSTLYASAYRAADGIRASVRGSCMPVFTGSIDL